MLRRVGLDRLGCSPASAARLKKALQKLVPKLRLACRRGTVIAGLHNPLTNITKNSVHFILVDSSRLQPPKLSRDAIVRNVAVLP
jgi:hypothetical protein